MIFRAISKEMILEPLIIVGLFLTDAITFLCDGYEDFLLENPKQHIYWLNSICVEWSMLYIVESVDDIHDVLTEALVVVAR